MRRIFQTYAEYEGPSDLSELIALRDLSRKAQPGKPSVYMPSDRVFGSALNNGEKNEVARLGNGIAARLFRCAQGHDQSLDFFSGPGFWHFFHSQKGTGDLSVATDFESWHADASVSMNVGAVFLLWVPQQELGGLELIRSRSTNRLWCNTDFLVPNAIQAVLDSTPDLEILRPQGNRLFVLPEACYHRRKPIDYAAPLAENARTLEDFGFRVDLV